MSILAASGREIMNYILIIAAAIIFLCCLTVVLIILLRRKKRGHRITINDEFINKLISLLGNKDNINDVSVDNGRLKIAVNDLDLVDLEGIKAIATSGVFVTGNIIKTLFRLDSQTIKKEMDSRL